MKCTVTLSFFLISTLISASVSAEPPGRAVVESSGQAAPPSPQPVETPPLAEVSAPIQGTVVYVAPWSPSLSLQAQEWERIHRYARVYLLQESMEHEGPDFSKAKYRKYRAEKITGIILTVLGGAAVLSAPVVAIVGGVSSFHVTYEEEYDDRGLSDFGAAALISFAAGAGFLGAGIPLIIAGRRGMERQKILRQRDEILNPKSAAVRLNLHADPTGRAFGVGVVMQF